MTTLEKVRLAYDNIINNPSQFWEIPFVLGIGITMVLFMRQITKDDFNK
tara:strand:- start:7774 stop:7920 length:147 start_codon:yes stop_codon:yes gene_type:complete